MYFIEVNDNLKALKSSSIIRVLVVGPGDFSLGSKPEKFY
jgi:hypothetical protein